MDKLKKVLSGQDGNDDLNVLQVTLVAFDSLSLNSVLIAKSNVNYVYSKYTVLWFRFDFEFTIYHFTCFVACVFTRLSFAKK